MRLALVLLLLATTALAIRVSSAPFSDGFERAATLADLMPGDFSRWHSTNLTAGNTLEPTTTRAHTGPQSLKSIALAAISPGGSKASIKREALTFKKGDCVRSDVWYWLVSGGTIGNGLFLWDLEDPSDPGGFAPGRRLYLSGESRWLKSDFKGDVVPHNCTQTVGSEVGLPVDQWVHIRVDMCLHETTGKFKAYQNGTLLISCTSKTILNATSSLSRVEVGLTANASTIDSHTLYTDDFSIVATPRACCT